MIATKAVWPTARRRLRSDGVFGPLVQRLGPIRVHDSDEDPFVYLARAIIYQQLAGAAAGAIHGRFVEALAGRVTADAVLRTPESELRAAGLSRAKLAAIRDLAAKAIGGEVRLDDLADQGDDEVLDRLVCVRGIGPWTAQMFLMFRLHRRDVWPVGDLGVRNGWALLHGLEEAPAAKELESCGEPYRPWRSAVAWYCWRALDEASAE